jgi:triacylglycerol lipase
VLAHGLLGFARIGVGRLTFTSYFRGIPQALLEAGNRVLVTRVPALGGVEQRAARLGEQILHAFPDEPVHVIGHSMGGLDARVLLRDAIWRKRILSLTTVGTPHLGSALADFAKLRVGRVYRLMSALGVEPRGCLDVTRRAARRRHRQQPALDDLPCFCVAGSPAPEMVGWPLRRTHAALSELEGANDGLVPVESALAFGTPLPLWPIDHLMQMNWFAPEEHTPSVPSPIELYKHLVAHLASLGFGQDSGQETRPSGDSDGLTDTPETRELLDRERRLAPEALPSFSPGMLTPPLASGPAIE